MKTRKENTCCSTNLKDIYSYQYNTYFNYFLALGFLYILFFLVSIEARSVEFVIKNLYIFSPDTWDLAQSYPIQDGRCASFFTALITRDCDFSFAGVTLSYLYEMTIYIYFFIFYFLWRHCHIYFKKLDTNYPWIIISTRHIMIGSHQVIIIKHQSRLSDLFRCHQSR